MGDWARAPPRRPHPTTVGLPTTARPKTTENLLRTSPAVTDLTASAASRTIAVAAPAARGGPMIVATGVVL